MLLSPAASRTGRAGHAWVDSNMRSGSEQLVAGGRLRRPAAVSYLERTMRTTIEPNSSGSTHRELSGCRGSNWREPFQSLFRVEGSFTCGTSACDLVR